MRAACRKTYMRSPPVKTSARGSGCNSSLQHTAARLSSESRHEHHDMTCGAAVAPPLSQPSSGHPSNPQPKRRTFLSILWRIMVSTSYSSSPSSESSPSSTSGSSMTSTWALVGVVRDAPRAILGSTITKSGGYRSVVGLGDLRLCGWSPAGDVSNGGATIRRDASSNRR